MLEVTANPGLCGAQAHWHPSAWEPRGSSEGSGPNAQERAVGASLLPFSPTGEPRAWLTRLTSSSWTEEATFWPGPPRSPWPGLHTASSRGDGAPRRGRLCSTPAASGPPALPQGLVCPHTTPSPLGRRPHPRPAPLRRPTAGSRGRRAQQMPAQPRNRGLNRGRLVTPPGLTSWCESGRPGDWPRRLGSPRKSSQSFPPEAGLLLPAAREGFAALTAP